MFLLRSSFWRRGWFFGSFATGKFEEKAKKQSVVFTKNQNLQFQDPDYRLMISPMYPQLVHKGGDNLTINRRGIVLYFKFISKHFSEVTLSEMKDSNGSSEPEDLSFSFTYQNLTQFLEVEPNSGVSKLVKRQRMKNREKVFDSLLLKDHPGDSKVTLQLRRTKHEEEEKIVSNSPLLKFTFEYLHYRILHLLLQKSLYDLSGSHLIQEINRLQQLGELQIEAFGKDFRY